MLTDWETWTEPVFNAIRLQKETKLKITLKWDIAEPPEKHQWLNIALKKAILIKHMKENTKKNSLNRLVIPRDLLILQFVINKHELYVSCSW